jgi:hypothetical protein
VFLCGVSALGFCFLSVVWFFASIVVHAFPSLVLLPTAVLGFTSAGVSAPLSLWRTAMLMLFDSAPGDVDTRVMRFW